MHQDSYWPKASDWLGSDSLDPRLGVVGIPTNKSVTPGKYDDGPDAIRNVLSRCSVFDMRTEGTDLRSLTVKDFGNLSLNGETAEQNKQVRYALQEMNAEKFVFLGGDNGLTRPAVLAVAEKFEVPLERMSVITLDAHLDLRHLEDGPMNGNPIRGLIEDGLPGSNICQIGLQPFANSREYAEFGRKAGIKFLDSTFLNTPDSMVNFQRVLDDFGSRFDAIYLDLDLDVMDRAFAPGCPGSRPGGCNPSVLRDIAAIAGFHKKVKAMDIVELDPSLDINDTTAFSGALCLLEFASGMLTQTS